MLPVMLPLVSSMTTTVIGWLSASKRMIGVGLPLSRMSKSSFTRSGTSRLAVSVTVTYTGTTAVPALKVGPCPARAASEGPAASRASDSTPATAVLRSIVRA